MSVCWRGLVLPASVVLLALSAAPSRAFADPAAGPNAPGADRSEAKPLLGITAGPSGAADPVLAEADAAVQAVMQNLGTVADYHPETDRWTERNNRIKISLWGSGMFFDHSLRVHHDAAVGLRVAWEVPGFIAIRLDGGGIPWSHLTVKIDKATKTTSEDHTTHRNIPGYAINGSLTIGIFNPELSTAAGPLAFWAGFGPEVWYFTYNQSRSSLGLVVPHHNSGGAAATETFVSASFSRLNVGGQIFIEMDFKIADIFHIGLGFKEHILFAPQTKEGRFYEVNGVNQANTTSDGTRNKFGGISFVHEPYLQVSVLF